MDRTSPFVSSLLVTAFVASLVVLVGSMLFFSAAVLPVVFINMGPTDGGAVAQLVFPYYYGVCLAASLVLLLVTFAQARTAGGRWRVAAGVAGAVFVIQAYAALVLYPEIVALRSTPADRSPRFTVLHERSVRLNGVALLGGIALVLGSGALLVRR